MALGVLLMGATACSDDGDDGGTTTTGAPGVTTTAPGSTPTTTSGPGGTVGRALGDVELKLTRVAEVSQPVAMAIRTGDEGLYVAEKTGRVRVLRGGRLQADAVLDLRSQVSTGGEQGLLGLAFSPDGKHLYVNFTDNEGDTRVVEYVFTDGKADSGTDREVLFVDQPFANHNGGNLVFGPDGMLWIGLGDGGGGNDPQDNAQSTGTLLGKMLRIDPKPSITSSYTVPTDNPFIGTTGARTEIWSLGLRNPWRYSFDKATGDLWIGDVGQGAREEIDFVAAGSRGGENFGWPQREGTRANKGAAPAGAIDPVFDYNQDGGACSVTGGYVYRGAAIPGLAGAYLYGDFCQGRVRALRLGADRSVVDQADLDLKVESLSSFGQDAAGELYALSLNGQIYRIDPA